MVQRYNILGRYTNQYLCLCSHAWPVEVSHGKIRVRPEVRVFMVFVKFKQIRASGEGEDYGFSFSISTNCISFITNNLGNGMSFSGL